MLYRQGIKIEAPCNAKYAIDNIFFLRKNPVMCLKEKRQILRMQFSIYLFAKRQIMW